MKVTIADCDRFVLNYPIGLGRGIMLEYVMAWLMSAGVEIENEHHVFTFDLPQLESIKRARK